MIIWLVVTGTWLDYDFPETVGNGIMIPIDFHSIIFQRGRSTHQPVIHLSMISYDYLCIIMDLSILTQQALRFWT